MLAVDGERPLRVTVLQCCQCSVPGDMAVQDPGPIIGRQPSPDQLVGLVVGAALIHGVRQGVRRIGIVRAKTEAALDEVAAERHVAVLRVRPAAIGEEPPIVRRELPGMALTEVHPCLIVVRAARKGEQPEGAERQRKHHDVARPSVGMGVDRRQCLPGSPVECVGQGGDMAALALGAAYGHQFRRLGNPSLGLRALGPHGVEAGAGRVGQSKARVGCNGRVQHGIGTRPRRKHQVHAVAVAFSRALGRGRDGQAAIVEVGHGGLLTLGWNGIAGRGEMTFTRSYRRLLHLSLDLAYPPSSARCRSGAPRLLDRRRCWRRPTRLRPQSNDMRDRRRPNIRTGLAGPIRS